MRRGVHLVRPNRFGKVGQPVGAYIHNREICNMKNSNEGYVSVPKIMSAELALKLAEADFRDISPLFNYEHRGLTSEQRAGLQSKWIQDKAIKYQILYQTLIGVTGSQHKHGGAL